MVALRVSTLRMSLVVFVSQMATALALDAWMTGSFSARQAAGCALVLAGLWVASPGKADSSAL
jgi:hypothetical protein